MTLIFFSDIPWASLHQRPQHLAARLAEQTTLLWVEPVTLGRRASFSPVPIGKNLYGVSLPLIPYNARNSVIRRMSHLVSRIPPVRAFLVWIQALMISKALRTLGLNGHRPICFVQNFQTLQLVSHLRPATVLYDCIDNPFGFIDFPPHVRQDWCQMLARADILVATSPNLRDLMRSETPKPVHIISNGVDYERFAAEPAARPADIPPPGRPVVGYVGSVYAWLDFELLGFFCLQAPDLEIVLVGHDHPATRDALHALTKFSNFSFLGVRPYGAVPSYLHAFDVGIIPFLRSPLTEGVNPVKLYEYSAAGLPIVATSFSPDLAAFRPMIAVCDTQEDFLTAIRRAIPLRHDPQHVGAAQSFARANDWQDKSRDMIRLVEEHTSHSLRAATS